MKLENRAVTVAVTAENWSNFITKYNYNFVTKSTGVSGKIRYSAEGMVV